MYINFIFIRLIINLTSPALLIYNEQIPMDKTMRNFYLQIISHLQSYKIALADDQIWTIVNKRLTNIFSIVSLNFEVVAIKYSFRISSFKNLIIIIG